MVHIRMHVEKDVARGVVGQMRIAAHPNFSQRSGSVELRLQASDVMRTNESFPLH